MSYNVYIQWPNIFVYHVAFIQSIFFTFRYYVIYDQEPKEKLLTAYSSDVRVN